MLRFRPISWADPCKKYIAHPCITSHASVKEQNLRNDEDVTKDTLGICRTCIKEEECTCICKKLIKNSTSLPSRTSCA